MVYALVGLTSLLNHHPYEAGFWWCVGATQVLGTLGKQQPPARRRWLTTLSALALVAALGLLSWHVRTDYLTAHP